MGSNYPSQMVGLWHCVSYTIHVTSVYFYIDAWFTECKRTHDAHTHVCVCLRLCFAFHAHRKNQKCEQRWLLRAEQTGEHF